jgi:glutamine synthetase
MAEAVARFSGSPFIAKAFGEEYRRVYGVMKAEELAAFSRTILPLEYDTYL